MIKESAGRVSSPNYPNNYESTLDCVTTIREFLNFQSLSGSYFHLLLNIDLFEEILGRSVNSARLFSVGIKIKIYQVLKKMLNDS